MYFSREGNPERTIETARVNISVGWKLSHTYSPRLTQITQTTRNIR